MILQVPVGSKLLKTRYFCGFLPPNVRLKGPIWRWRLPTEKRNIPMPSTYQPRFSGWWLNQPIWKICSSNRIISPCFGVKSITPSHLNKFIGFKRPCSENAPMTTASLRNEIRGTRWKELFMVPIQPMGLAYLPTWMVDFDGKCK